MAGLVRAYLKKRKYSGGVKVSVITDKAGKILAEGKSGSWEESLKNKKAYVIENMKGTNECVKAMVRAGFKPEDNEFGSACAEPKAIVKCLFVGGEGAVYSFAFDVDQNRPKKACGSCGNLLEKAKIKDLAPCFKDCLE